MEKIRQGESLRDYRYGLYQKDQPVGLGDNFTKIMEQKKKLVRMLKRDAHYTI